MLQQKRIRKPPQPLTLLYPEHSKKTKSSKGKKKPKRCTYQMIPYPNKFIYSTKIYSISTDMVILEVNNTLAFEVSLLNRFMKYEHILVNGTPGDKIVTIKIDRRKGPKFLSWRQVVKKLKATREPKMIEWSNLIKTFCEKHDNIIEIEELPLEHSMETSQRQELTLARPEHREELNNLLKSYPCILLRSGLNSGKLGISEVVMNEKLVNELEYPIDEFASTVLEDGIPQIMPYESEANIQILRTILEKYFSLKGNSYKTPEYHTMIFSKNNHIKDITLQVYLFPTIFQEKEGVDIVFTIKDIGYPYSEEQTIPKSRINRNYTEKTLANIQETHYFLSTFYRELMPIHHANPDKVCGIRELDPPSDLEDHDDYDFETKVEQAKLEEI